MVVDILFERGKMTRQQVASILRESGEFRTLPNDSSLTAILCKNLQIKQVGYEMVEQIGGLKTKNAIYEINADLIKSEKDIVYTRPYSAMTTIERNNAKVCPKCRQMRLIEDRWSECLVCLRL